MEVTIKIPEAIVPSVEKWILQYHSERRFDEKSGEPKNVPLHTVKEFIILQIDQLLDRIDDEFPPASTAAQRQQIEDLRKQMKSKIKAKEVTS